MEIFISAPFGNYIHPTDTIAVTGTWTLEPRGNRLLSVAKTLRYNFSMGGWQNKLGLPNPGIDVGLSKIKPDQILSVAQINGGDFQNLSKIIPFDQNIEVNLSCPNVDVHFPWISATHFKETDLRQYCIAKVSPLTSLSDLKFLIDKIGFRQLHFSNTLPLSNDRGGLSGKTLIPYTKDLIRLTRDNWGDDIEIIAGGGIQHIGHVTEYMNAGANHISLGSVCFHPIKLWKLLRALR
jgi:dihydroorotate dehydrogenase